MRRHVICASACKRHRHGFYRALVVLVCVMVASTHTACAQAARQGYAEARKSGSLSRPYTSYTGHELLESMGLDPHYADVWMEHTAVKVPDAGKGDADGGGGAENKLSAEKEGSQSFLVAPAADDYAYRLQDEQNGGDRKVLPYVINGWLDAHHNQMLPFCLYFFFVDWWPVVCVIMRVAYAITMYDTPDFELLTSEHHPMNTPDNALPMDLEDMTGRLPLAHSQELIEREKTTYYWYMRVVFNMYAYVFRYADLTQGRYNDAVNLPEELRPLVPPEWRHERTFFETFADGWRWPFGKTMVQDRHLVIVIRGTIFPGAWETDFTSVYAPIADTQNLGVPGRTHAGFTNFTLQFYDEFVEHVEDIMGGQAIDEVTFTGHSLGGAIAILLAGSFTTLLPKDVRINAVTFAAPVVGDPVFSDWVSSIVNLRKIVYIGVDLGAIPSLHSFRFGAGDVVPQIPPACEQLNTPVCQGVGNPDALKKKDVSETHYKSELGSVPFYATNLRNADAWVGVEEVSVPDIQKVISDIITNHVCSYQCWLAPLMGDSNDRCEFATDIRQNPHACVVSRFELMQQRFPFITHPPPTSDSTQHANPTGLTGTSKRLRVRD